MRKLVYSLTTMTALSLCVGCSQSNPLSMLDNNREDAPIKTAAAVDDSMQFDLARASEKQGKLLQAQEMYLHLLEESPRDVDVLHRLGVVSSRLNEYDQASHYFMQALRIDKHNSEILADLGYSMYLKGDLKAAETALRQASREDAGNERAINNLAMVVGEQGRTDEAYALFRSVVDEAEANANLAYVMSRRGAQDEAAKRYSLALTIDEDLEQAQVALLQIAERQQIAQRLKQMRQGDEPELQTAQTDKQRSPKSQTTAKVRPVSSSHNDEAWYDNQSADFELPAVIDSIEE